MLVGYDEFGELWICSPCWEVHHSDEDLLPENGIKILNGTGSIFQLHHRRCILRKGGDVKENNAYGLLCWA